MKILFNNFRSNRLNFNIQNLDIFFSSNVYLAEFDLQSALLSQLQAFLFARGLHIFGIPLKRVRITVKAIQIQIRFTGRIGCININMNVSIYLCYTLVLYVCTN
jgi:hypothetical protein